jgi:hypothetical protein
MSTKDDVAARCSRKAHRERKKDIGIIMRALRTIGLSALVAGFAVLLQLEGGRAAAIAAEDRCHKQT